MTFACIHSNNTPSFTATFALVAVYSKFRFVASFILTFFHTVAHLFNIHVQIGRCTHVEQALAAAAVCYAEITFNDGLR